MLFGSLVIVNGYDRFENDDSCKEKYAIPESSMLDYWNMIFPEIT